jgi:hypothetical protein
MTEKIDALTALAETYRKRGQHEEAVRRKYANFERELAEAKEKDVDTVAQAMVAAWNAGASVAATGRALATSNIYSTRRKYYDRAKELQGEVADDERALMDRLYRIASGQDFLERRTGDEPVETTEENYHEVPVDEEGYPDQEAWVLSWEISNIDAETWKVDDPAGRVNTISMGKVLGYQGKNLTEFMKDDALHEIVYRVFPQVKMEEN